MKLSPICFLLAGLSTVSYAQMNLLPNQQGYPADSSAFNRNIVHANGQYGQGSQYGQQNPNTPQMPTIYKELPMLTGQSGETDLLNQLSADVQNKIAQDMANFDLLVIVNKGSSAETVEPYKKVTSPVAGYCPNGSPTAPCIVPLTAVDPDWKAGPHYTSSGTEEYGCTEEFDQTTGCFKPERLEYRQTPTGFYTVFHLEVDAASSEYANAAMPYAVYIRDELGWDKGGVSGIATHQAPTAGEATLISNRESHGCMRLSLSDAQEIFKQVALTGGPINRKDVDFNVECRAGDSQAACNARQAAYQKFIDTIPTPAYPAAQSIPTVMRQTGDLVQTDTSGRKQVGYKTLYVVTDIETSAPRTNYVVDAIVANPKVKVASWDHVTTIFDFLDNKNVYAAVRGVSTKPYTCPAHSQPSTCTCTQENGWGWGGGWGDNNNACSQITGQGQSSSGYGQRGSGYGQQPGYGQPGYGGAGQQQYQPNPIGNFFNSIFGGGN